MSGGAAGRRAIRRDALGVGIATGSYGLSFGAVATAAGLSLGQTCALSLLMFTGASQFAFVGVLAGGGTPLAGAAGAVLLGSRNALYGLRLANLIGVRGPRRGAAAHLVIDESAAMAVGQGEGAPARQAFWATGLSVFLLWNAGTLVGAVGAGLLADPRALGLDAAAPAAFLALIALQLRERRPWAVALTAAVVALAAAPLVPTGAAVLVAGLVVAAVALMRPRR